MLMAAMTQVSDMSKIQKHPFLQCWSLDATIHSRFLYFEKPCSMPRIFHIKVVVTSNHIFIKPKSQVPGGIQAKLCLRARLRASTLAVVLSNKLGTNRKGAGEDISRFFAYPSDGKNL